MKKGYIFSARHTSADAVHPIIFWENTGGGEFIGLMITHSPNFNNLDLSDANYFAKNAGKFKNTYFVQALLLKPVDWLVGAKIKGNLSELGIAYVESIVHQLTPISWDEHLRILHA